MIMARLALVPTTAIMIFALLVSGGCARSPEAKKARHLAERHGRYATGRAATHLFSCQFRVPERNEAQGDQPAP